MWLVVHFTEDNTVECVPKIWYSPEEKSCWFPPNYSSGKMYELIRGLQPVQRDSWNKYNCKVLGHEYDNFKLAQNKAERARESNFLTSGSESPIVSLLERKGKRTIKRNPKYSSPATSSDGEGDSDVDSNEFPDVPSRIDNVDVQLGITNLQPVRNTPKPVSTSTINKANSETTLNEYQKQVLRELTLIKNIVKQHSEMFDVLLANTTHQPQDVDNDLANEFTELCNMWPMDINNLNKLEEIIQTNKNLLNLMVKELSRIGGNDAANLTKKILYRVLSNEAGQHYSWEGAKGKLSFKKLTLANVIISAVRKNKATAEATDNSIIDAIKKWLVKAKQREANKEKKEKERENNGAIN